MKTRPKGFLAENKIDHTGEIFDYIRELHDYLWDFIKCEFPWASGTIEKYLDTALEKRKAEKEMEKFK